jgi:hypothetical protein
MALVQTAFSDFTRMAIADQPPAGRKAPITIDLVGLKFQSICLTVKSGCSGMRLIIVVLCRDKGRTVAADKATGCNQLHHTLILLSFKWIRQELPVRLHLFLFSFHVELACGCKAHQTGSQSSQPKDTIREN